METTFRNYFAKIFLLLLFTVHFSYSQYHHGLEIGVGMNTADFLIDESVEPTNALAFNIGYIAERDLSDNLYLRLAFIFKRREINAINRRGINTTEEKWGLDAFEIPVNFGYYVNWNNRNFQFFVDAGASFGYNSRAIVTNDEESIRLDIGGEGPIQRIALGANVGVGALIKKRFKFRLHYYHGLSNNVNTEDNIWKNRTYGISLHYFLKERPLVY